jgi:hypothetical protein
MNIKNRFRSTLNENNHMRSVVRDIVRDIINVFKKNDNGYFHLPEYFSERDEMLYNIANLNVEVNVELTLIPEKSSKSFQIDANYVNNEETIEIVIKYNPEVKNSILYDIVGELNELIAHELRHLYQEVKGTYDLAKPQTKDNSYEYYTQEHELDAQRAGFKRLAKLTKTPMDVVVKRWFKTHQDIHGLTDEEITKVISKILNI